MSEYSVTLKPNKRGTIDVFIKTPRKTYITSYNYESPSEEYVVEAFTTKYAWVAQLKAKSIIKKDIRRHLRTNKPVGHFTVRAPE